MSTHSSRHGGSASRAKRRLANFIRLRCEQVEDRITPANLFNVQTPITGSMNNNGFVVVTDLNKDGNADAILTNEGVSYLPSGDKNIVVLYGHGNGTFTKATFPTGAENVAFAAVADINGDGYPDVVTVSQNNAGDQSSTNQGVLTVFKNDGSGNLIPVGSQSTDSVNPSWVGLADVTGDGVLDVVVGSFGPDDQTGQSVDGKITIFQGLTDASGHGDFTFSASPITVIQPDQTFIPTALAVGDFDGDGIVDIAAAVPQAPADTGEVPPDGLIDIFRGTGAGGFTAQPVAQYDSGGINPVNIQLADVNGDHKADLIISNTGDATAATATPDGQALWYQDGVEVLPNTSTLGNPTFGVANSVVLTANLYGSFATAVADFNGDGKPDIAVVNYGGTMLVSSTPAPATVAIFQGNGNGTFTTTTPGTYSVGTKPNSQPVLGGQYLAAGDFDNNGTPDLIVATADNYEYTSTTSSAGLLLNASPPPPTVASVQVNDGSAQRSEVRSIQVTFSGPVSFTGGNASTAAAFQLQHVTDSANVTLSAVVTVDSQSRTVVTLKFSGSETDPVSASNGGVPSLADGRYTLTVLSSRVTANGEVLNGGGPNGNFVSPTDTAGGGAGQLQLYRLFGDATGDGQIDSQDLGQFRSTYNLGTGATGFLTYLDADNSGQVDSQDLGQFRSRYNGSVFPQTPHMSLPPAPPPPPTVSSIEVNDGSAQRSEVRSITVAFSQPVTFSNGDAATAFQLTSLTDGNDVALSAAVSADAQGHTLVTLTFSGAETDAVSGDNGGAFSLADGRYQLTILGNSVIGANGVALSGDGSGTAGTDYVSPADTQGGGTGELHLFRLFGDVNGDGTVDASDLGQLRATMNAGVGSSMYLAYLDADNSGAVDSQDLGLFRSRYNHSVF